jgi:hypothetical protein
MDKPIRTSAQTTPAVNAHSLWFGFVSGVMTVAVIWFLLSKMNPPASFIVALILAIGFWGAGSIPRLRARWHNFARELRLTSAGFVGVAATILIFEVIW